MTIHRRSILEVGVLGAAAASFSPAAAQIASTQPSGKTYVLVHGAWHGGWCWKEVAESLRRMGHGVTLQLKLVLVTASTCCRKISPWTRLPRISSIILRLKSSTT